MALKNKDGTVYQLNRPNPITKEQDFWETDESKYVLHNCDWTPDMVAGEEAARPLKSDFHVPDEVAVAEEPARKAEPVFEIPQQMDIPSPPVESKPPVQEEPKKRSIPDSVLKNSMIFWCLPHTSEIKTDGLYEESYGVGRFGKKFTFEGVMVERGDLAIRFWTTVKQVTKGSIVYPSRYTHRNEECKDYRWWKVQGVMPKSTGWLIYAVLSDITPDFSD